MLIIIDNYDSFTYNLYQAFAEIYPNVKVIKNDEMTLEEIEAMHPIGIVLSPGPGRPEESGVSLDCIRHFQGKIPILGVCLGHQALGVVFGGSVDRSPQIQHGKKCLVFHSRKDLFEKMPLPFEAGRYHSLIVNTVPEGFVVDAESPDGLVMGMRHQNLPIFGVQFHPESILTPQGKTLLANFVRLCG